MRRKGRRGEKKRGRVAIQIIGRRKSHVSAKGRVKILFISKGKRMKVVKARKRKRIRHSENV